MPRISDVFFLEREQLFCEQQLCFEAAGALYELEDALVLRVVLRLAAGLARHERAAAADRELRVRQLARSEL